jgi:hypothetical protein
MLNWTACAFFRLQIIKTGIFPRTVRKTVHSSSYPCNILRNSWGFFWNYERIQI